MPTIHRPHPFAGRGWWYQFGPELEALQSALLNRFINDKFQRFAERAKSWNEASNTEWMCRVFFAGKMVMAASIHYASLYYAREKNLKAAVPYLQYYALLYSLKSLVFMLPEREWHEGSIVTQTHRKTINIACDEIAKISELWGQAHQEPDSPRRLLGRIKAFRELISYRAPSSGGNLEGYDTDITSLCVVPIELAQMLSEILEQCLEQHLPDGFTPELKREGLKMAYATSIDEYDFLDNEDRLRIRQLAEGRGLPSNILFTLSEGHVEDYFGSWCDPQDREGVFYTGLGGGLFDFL